MGRWKAVHPQPIQSTIKILISLLYLLDLPAKTPNRVPKINHQGMAPPASLSLSQAYPNPQITQLLQTITSHNLSHHRINNKLCK